jgi:hypothetical protein
MSSESLTPKEGILLDKEGTEIPVTPSNSSQSKDFFRASAFKSPGLLMLPVVAVTAIAGILFILAAFVLGGLLMAVLRLFGVKTRIGPKVQVFSSFLRRG